MSEQCIDILSGGAGNHKMDSGSGANEIFSNTQSWSLLIFENLDKNSFEILELRSEMFFVMAKNLANAKVRNL